MFSFGMSEFVLFIVVVLSQAAFTLKSYLEYKKLEGVQSVKFKSDRLFPEIRYLLFGFVTLFIILTCNTADGFFIAMIISIVITFIYKYKSMDADFSNIKYVLYLLIFINIISLGFFEVKNVSSASMYPNYKVNSLVFANKNTYGIKLPVFDKYIKKGKDVELGDVILFKYPFNNSIIYLKRVVAVGGDVIEYIDKDIYINGVKNKVDKIMPLGTNGDFNYYIETNSIGNEYNIVRNADRDSLYVDISINGEFTSGCEYYVKQKLKCKVPDGHIFVMGDNRDDSFDSRYFGFVNLSKVIGKVN